MNGKQSEPAPASAPSANLPVWGMPGRKWLLLTGYWVVQGAAAYVIAAAWVTFNSESGGPSHPLYAFDFAEFFRLMANPEWAVSVIGGTAVLSAIQAVFLLPVARPRVDLETRGISLRLSAAAAAGTIAALWAAALCAVLGVVQLADLDVWNSDVDRTVVGVILGSTLLTWIVATPMVLSFLGRGRREAALARFASTVFLGTVVEAVAIMPLDVMMRRKTNCYCNSGTYWALSVCGTVGLFVIGPAIFLPLLARRRKRWYASRCDVCGYDMGPTPAAARCPECGAGWRDSK